MRTGTITTFALNKVRSKAVDSYKSLTEFFSIQK
jgi:hypothetical protein